MIDFTNLEYLRSGTDKQRETFVVLTENRVLDKLKGFDPILTGTIPIKIDIDTSDLDIICCFTEAGKFQQHLIEAFASETNFRLFTPKHPGALACSFMLKGFLIEVFGQPIPTRNQNAYIHMLAEHKILEEKGEVFRQQVIALKKQGFKTEPAFGKLLGLTGNVYEQLLRFHSSD